MPSELDAVDEPWEQGSWARRAIARWVEYVCHNAVTVAAVTALVGFMHEFQRKQG